VAILCNHQRSVPKTHEQSMGRMQEKLDKMREEVEGLERDLALARKGKDKDGDRRIGSEDQ
jgi:DNA topoisomerase-1